MNRPPGQYPNFGQQSHAIRRYRFSHHILSVLEFVTPIVNLFGDNASEKILGKARFTVTSHGETREISKNQCNASVCVVESKLCPMN
jgi:hypothetical protein